MYPRAKEALLVCVAASASDNEKKVLFIAKGSHMRSQRNLPSHLPVNPSIKCVIVMNIKLQYWNFVRGSAVICK